MLALDEIKVELEKRKLILNKRVSEMEAALRSEHSTNFSEQAHEREDEEVMERLEQEALQEIEAINHALTRIENDTYGVCSVCGGDIGEKRLKVLPYAGLCISCAE
ncbi:TraR/DksA family transcriptional regulator [Sneathiella sp. P13V-1]|uniref:TraR/DksA family transcriptional regulator n=1 Tax=Sneathiella sp. P13V-1 TaxID=2697366 RepID=UPI00187BA293|nr:TraR/DksA family transcriptional regulator [Sneathiella sp. P13V-1]MBE7638421.1 TraR/DksA family transcriptional regulator [Sneathiella sp. P13V-1]